MDTFHKNWYGLGDGNDSKICCNFKKNLMTNNNLFNSIQLNQRYVIFTKAKKSQTYLKIIEVTNSYFCQRRFKVHSNFPTYLSFKVKGSLDVVPDFTFSIEICLEPILSDVKSFEKTQRFAIFLSCDHPKITIEIPVFIFLGTPDLIAAAAPHYIRMQNSHPNILTYYTFIIYNPLNKLVSFNLKQICSSFHDNFNIHPENGAIPSKSFMTIYLSGFSTNLCPIRPELLIRFSDGGKLKVLIDCEMEFYLPYLNKRKIIFEEIYLGTQTEECLQICNDSMEVVKFKWCRHETQEESQDNAVNQLDENVSFIKSIDNIFLLKPKCGTIQPFSSITITPIFSPPSDIPDEPPVYPFVFETKGFLAVSSNPNRRIPVNFRGTAIGADIQFLTKEIDLGPIFIGEKTYKEITAKNFCPIKGSICFKNFDSVVNSNFCITPKCLILEPKEPNTMLIQYNSNTLGKFLDKIVFKIKYGEERTVVLKGDCVPIRLKTFPNTIEFGRVPMCMLQKRTLMVSNPLSVPITIECLIENDGTEEPLMLDIKKEENHIDNVDNSDNKSLLSTKTESNDDSEENGTTCESMFSFWVYESNINLIDKGQETCGSLCDLFTLGKSISNCTYPYNQDDVTSTKTASTCSHLVEWNDDIQDNISAIAVNLLQNLKSQKTVENSEADIKVLNNMFEEFKTFCNSNKIKNFLNFQHLDWENMSTNPREFLIEKHVSYLKPNESKNMEIYLIPNTYGNFTATIKIKCCPVQTTKDLSESEQLEPTIDSSLMTTKVNAYYNCLIPDIAIEEPMIHMNNGYVELPLRFEMIIKNLNKSPGFVHFKLVPNLIEGKVHICPRKFFIAGNEAKKIRGYVTFSRTGDNVLPGVVNIVGGCRPRMYKFTCNVKPPEIRIEPKQVNVTQRVLELVKTRIFVENICPTKARIVIGFKKESKFFSCEPLGGILGPNQSVLITLSSLFYDPGVYLNSLEINLTHYGIIKVPLKFTVEGLAIITIPNLEFGYNFGTNFLSNNAITAEIELKNYGERLYKLNVSKVKAKLPKDQDENSIFEIVPNPIVIKPKSNQKIVISAKAETKGIFKEMFAIEGIYNRSKRVKWIKFEAAINLINSQLKWNKENVLLFLDNSEFSEKHILSDKIQLTNTAPICSEVELKVIGNFILMLDCPTGSVKNEEQFLMEPKQTLDYIVIFEEGALNDQNRNEMKFKGKIIPVANGKKQKTLTLSAQLSYPTLSIFQPKQIYFSRNVDFFSKFYIKNFGNFKCSYEWKLINEEIANPDHKETPEMKSLQSFSQLILAKPAKHFLTNPIDIDEEFAESQYKMMMKSESDQFMNPKVFPVLNYRDEVQKIKSTSSTVLNKKLKLKKLDRGDEGSLNLKKGNSKKRMSIKSLPDDFVSEELSPSIESKEEEIVVEFDEIIDEISEFLKTYKNNWNDEEDDDFSSLVRSMKETEEFEENYAEEGDEVENVLVREENESCNIFNRSVSLDHYQGQLETNELAIMNLFYDSNYDGMKLESTYQLSIIGGETNPLQIIVYDFKGKIGISKTQIALGIQPWYKKTHTKVELKNPNSIPFNIKILSTELNYFYGYANTNQHPQNFILQENQNCCLPFEVFTGFSSYFHKNLGIEINDCIPVPIMISGSGKIPMLSILNLDRPFSNQIDRTIEYQTLNFMYKNEIEDKIIIENEEPSEKEIKFFLNRFKLNPSFLSNVKSVELDYFVSPRSGKISKNPIQTPQFKANIIEKYDPDIEDFMVFDYPSNYPNQLYIEHEIEKSIYLKNLSKMENIAQRFVKIINKYILDEEEYKKKVNLKSLIIQPLGHYVAEYRLEISSIILNKQNTFLLELIFHGPGRLILSARSEVLLIGFDVDFKAKNVGSSKVPKQYTIKTPHIILPNSMYKYRNKSERNSNFLPKNCKECWDCQDFCISCRIKLCHAHSYDFDLHKIHQREFDSKLSRKEIFNYYTKLSQNFKETKNPFVLSEFYLETFGQDYSENVEMEMLVHFNPSCEIYEDGREFEEYIFIDIHLGPTIPILIHGTFKSQIQCDLEKILDSDENI